MKNKHPYYDSDRKQSTESFSLKMIKWSLIVVGFLLITTHIITCNHSENGSENIILGPSHNYQIPTKIKFVSDSVYQQNQIIIDSLTTVEELLEYLATSPPNPISLQEGPDDTEHTWVGDNGEPFKE